MDTPLGDYIRIMPEHKKALSRLGVSTARDLLYYFPNRYSDMSMLRLVRDLKAGETATIAGRITNIATKKGFRSKIPMAEGAIEDINGDTIPVVWYHQAYLAKMLMPGDTVKLTGKVTESKKGLYLANPEHEKIPILPIDTHESLFGEGDQSFGYPIYPETRGVTSKWIYHAIQKLFAKGALEKVVDPIPESVRATYHLPDLSTALIWIHTPKRREDAEMARKRFAFEEIFLIQLAKQQSRFRFEHLDGYQIPFQKKETTDFITRFPFDPTPAQTSAIDQILKDMSLARPMSRLVEGDVGSGKTFIAAVAAHAVVSASPRDNKYGRLQVGYMAPTEVLAAQLFENFISYFKYTITVPVMLVTGSGCRKFPSKVNPSGWTEVSQSQAKKWIASGEIPIVIGTHALISKSVKFKNLGLVVIDEQHRFGTNQRMKLVKKESAGHQSVPHYLSMTATPIPRTLALTMYGDLDLSVVDTMPAGRKPVITEIVAPDKRDRAYEKIADEMNAGRQVYVICPRINEPDPEAEQKMIMKSVESEAKRLGQNVFPKARIGTLHSKMSKEKKEKIMQEFSRHDLDILVATSVIEVGVNVPNATSIIIEGAERFGLAQLHQLRGRVLRSSHQAYCYLFTDSKSEATQKRLQALSKAKNGFELSEMDLVLRGAGDLVGGKQWGVSDIGMEALKNLKMVEAARTEARNMIDQDPNLEKFPILASLVARHQEVFHGE